jgi:ubiquitin C-terminal hydrolase
MESRTKSRLPKEWSGISDKDKMKKSISEIIASKS